MSGAGTLGVLLLLTLLPDLATPTSFKMDFLSAGTVRTDPLMFSKTGECLSDHVHRFYGASSELTMRPEVSYSELRSAGGNTGNVEENKSLYWNPAIYRVNNPSGDTTFELVDVWFASAYYIWTTGQATAFPNGLKMKASDREEVARVRVVCDGASACEREDDGGCEGYGPSNQTLHGFLPVQACWELEINIKFPTCWDGSSLEGGSREHVVYSEECDGKEHNECFDLPCPASHPVRLPELHLYVRVLEYQGGAHMFSDGSDVFHSDYFSGWDEEKLQQVLDGCENESEAANPDFFCSDFLTFRGKPKQEGVQVEDLDIAADLEKIQPDPVDIRGLISPEEVTEIPELPRGVCQGTLIPYSDMGGAVGAGNSTWPEEMGCCRSKMVGDTNYNLVDWAESEAWKGEGMSLPSECYSGCVYQKEGDNSGTVFCFAMGGEQVTCNDARK